MLSYKDISEDLRNTICALYDSQISPEEITTQTDICRDLVYQILFEEQKITATGQYKPNYKNRHITWKEAVADYYLTHSRFQTKDFFRTSHTCVDRIIEEFHLPKRTHAEELRITHTHNYGSHEAYVEHMIQAMRDTSTQRYGVDNFAKSDLFLKKSVETCRKKYGVDNAMQCEEIKQHLSESCMEKFGVAWSCMREEAKLGGVGSDSGPNLSFLAKLKQHFSDNDIKREFCVEKFNYDFKIGNNLIEIDPASTHNSTWGVYKSPPKEKTYHQQKSKLAKKHGYRCIHVWDWDNIDAIVNLLLPREKVFARNCSIQLVDKSIAEAYLSMYHIQSSAKSDISIGLYYKDTLVSLMTFGKPRYNKKYQYELVRYCAHFNVVGGAEKLFRYFVKNYNPESIVSYCDLSKFTGNTYEKLGFNRVGASISKHWVSMKNGKHITDNLLRQHGFDQLLGAEYGYYGKGTSNEELMLKHNFVVVYDAGQATYVWKHS